MKATINYSEMVDYIESHYKVRPNISYVDTKTINVSYKASIFLPGISINVHIESVTEETIILSYDCSQGTKLLIKGILAFLKEQLKENNLTIDDEHNCILIHIKNIEPVQKALEYISLTDIMFTHDGIEVSAKLR